MMPILKFITGLLFFISVFVLLYFVGFAYRLAVTKSFLPGPERIEDPEFKIKYDAEAFKTFFAGLIFITALLYISVCFYGLGEFYFFIFKV